MPRQSSPRVTLLLSGLRALSPSKECSKECGPSVLVAAQLGPGASLDTREIATRRGAAEASQGQLITHAAGLCVSVLQQQPAPGMQAACCLHNDAAQVCKAVRTGAKRLQRLVSECR